MQAKLSPLVQKTLTGLYKKDKDLVEKIQKQILMFESNPKHPSLRLHKLSGNLNTIWSISINKKLRMIYIQDGNVAYFFDIGSHDQVYKK